MLGKAAVKVKLEEVINKDGHMRLAASLSRNIMETLVGGISYKFKFGPRRHTFFFEDIGANYIKACENAGYADETKEIGEKWGALIINQLVPGGLKKLPTTIFLNTVMRKIWVNLGLMDNISFEKNEEILTISTENEAITRTIGKNKFLVGFYGGVLEALLKSKVSSVDVLQKPTVGKYTFEIKDEPFNIAGKKKKVYYELNRLPNPAGFTLKKALRNNLLQLKGNNIYFRGKLLTVIENTLFHIIGNHGILLDNIPSISHEFFKNLIVEDSTDIEKLNLLKNLLQVMGWGNINIATAPGKNVFEIKNPPYGLQTDKENWDVLINTVLGYLWIINKDFRAVKVIEKYKKLSVIYSTS